MVSIVEQVLAYGKSQSEKLALTDGKNELSYGDLAKSVFYAQDVLKNKYNLKKGDAIIIAADKQVEFVSLYFACHLMGVVTLPIAPDTNPKRYELIKMKVNPVLVVGFKDNGSDVKVCELGEFAGIKEETNHDYEINLDDLADIMFTTGTTGEPKGVQLTKRNIAAASKNINSFIGNSKDDVEMIALPISHSFGIGRLRCALSNGQSVVLLGSFANVKRFFRFMEEYKVNGFGMVPASWAFLKKMSGMKIGEYKDQLHYIEIGSAPMPIEEKRALIEALPDTRICMHYGLTEASRSCFMEFHEDKERLNTVGKQSPNMFVSICDEQGKELDNNTEGEICVQGDAVTIGYLDLPKEESFWGYKFRTGDWGIKDDDGYITLKSRKKELINVGGKKVSPMEVEEVLKTFDFVEDCVCVGASDPEGVLGEVVKAYIVTSNPEMVSYDIIDGMIGKSLESYKHPLVYELIDEVPKTSSGKIQRLSLK